MSETATGVIGVGSFGKHHVRIYSELPQSRLAGIYDADRNRAAEIAKMFDTKAFHSIEELLDSVEAVTVATPTTEHASLAISALNKGIHTLVEKPIATSVKEADDIIDSASRSSAVLAVGHVERFNAAFRTSTEDFDELRYFHSERLGPWTGRGDDVDVVMDLMVHDLDLLAALDPSNTREIAAGGRAVRSGKLDIASVTITLESGATAVLQVSRVSDKKHRVLRLYSDQKSIYIDLLGQKAWEIRAQGKGSEPALLRKELRIPEKESLREELIAFLGRVNGERTPITSGEEARRTLITAKEIIDSALRQS